MRPSVGIKILDRSIRYTLPNTHTGYSQNEQYNSPKRLNYRKLIM